MPRKNNLESASTLQRQWLMLMLIPRSPKRISARDLALRLANEGFQVSARTIQRDLNQLSSVLQLAGDGQKPQGWSYLPNARQFDIPGLEPQAALAFHMAETYLRGVLPTSTLDMIKPWFDTANAVLDANGNGLAKWPTKIRVLPRGMPTRMPTIDQNVQAVVYQALLQDQKLRIAYNKNINGVAPAKPLTSIVSPLALVVRDGVVYLVCVYDGHSQPRQLALHRMSAAEQLEISADRPKGFSIDEYIAEGEFGISLNPKPIKLEAEFLKHVAIHLRESPITDSQTITEVDEDNVLLRATVADTLELRFWLKSFGDEVEVLKPVSLRREFQAMAQNLHGYYTE